jgi:hypothetical protein
MLESLMGREDDPGERLKVLVAIWLSAKDRIVLYGCPIGTLSSELAKRDPDDAVGSAAGVVLGKLVTLAQGQFEAMGRADARALALQMVGAYEGAALLSHALRDPQILADQAARLNDWIDEINQA